jgi:HD-like signal output (HDOD) protein
MTTTEPTREQTELQLPTLQDLSASIAELRPLPAAAMAILRITEHDRFSAHELAATISSDQALTAKLLRLSNSAYYGFPRTIGTVRDAVVLLGFRAVRATTLASCVIDTLHGSTHVNYDEFWYHSVSTGMLAEMLARAEGIHQDEAFTAGVLHNIGTMALDQGCPELMAASLEYAREQGVSRHAAQQAIIGYTDADLGGALASRWQFPVELVESIRDHAMSLENLPDPRSLTAFIMRARMLTRSYGVPDGIEHPGRQEPPEEWAMPPLSVALSRAGGIEGILERVGSFLDSATN